MTFMSKSYITAYETIKMKSEKIIEIIEPNK